MGGSGSGRNSGRPTIEQGLKLDLRSLRRRGQFCPDGNCRYVGLQWTYTYTNEKVASIGMSYCAGSEEGWLRLTYTSTPYGSEPVEVNETFQLERFPQPFGGSRWYIVCPRTNRRCQCLYLPPGATRFRSRQGFRVRLQYQSQKLDRHGRLMETGRKIARRVLQAGPQKWREEHQDWDFPPKPPWMRWKTYNWHYARWEWYEQKSDACFVQRLLKLGGLDI
jgi:hypothetical protein